MGLEAAKPLQAAHALLQSVLNAPTTNEEAIRAAEALMHLYELTKDIPKAQWALEKKED